MKDLLIEYKDQILILISFITLPFLVFISSLGSVYLFGRMLNIVKKATHKNIVALVSMVACYVFYFYYFDVNLTLIQKFWSALIYCSISIVLYVLIGFKLYDRVDNLFDKVAEDKKKKKH